MRIKEVIIIIIIIIIINCCSGGIMVLVYDVISQDHVIKG